ncbi:hypothetical protein H5410_062059 [Solanum commersonii]|uniref:DUF4283 domain-containing protein n=1 Tax=Solanum commersonii TaxID=4109 RepID=A0A9J5W9N7_SOLCO|nr:hypothetical protein H5410_062059 [Solanum commersonii]
MRTITCDVNFKIDEETMAWISFLNLFPTFFGKESLFSLATAVGKPLQLDQATINQSRPSCAKVRVLVDLAPSLPKAVVVNILDAMTGKLKSDKIPIKYDYIPKYCSECKIQGHTKNRGVSRISPKWNIHKILHPELWEFNESKKMAKETEVKEPSYPKICGNKTITNLVSTFVEITYHKCEN